MPSRRTFLRSTALLPALFSRVFAADAAVKQLDPRGRIHIPIGIPNTVDTLKTFVEAEGIFSPGVGSYGIYFWMFDLDSGKLTAPTMDGVVVEHGLSRGGLLIPWSSWRAGELSVKTEICEVQLESTGGGPFVVGAKARVTNKGAKRRRVALYAVLRPLGPAGWDVKRLEVDTAGDLLLVEGHTAIVADRRPSRTGVLQTDTIGELAMTGNIPSTRTAYSDTGDCSGAMRFDWTIAPHSTEQVGFVCPVLPGRRAARHHWVDWKQDAMVDTAQLNPKEGGILQPDPGPAFFRGLRVEAIFQMANAYWSRFFDGGGIQMPDPRWSESMNAILGHAAICMNEGAPDVAVVNYNVFNRDGMYIANIMQKGGRAALSEQILNYFVSQPFNGRAYPEADNPGQILCAIHQHWLLTRDKGWLQRIYPSVCQIAAMIRYYRTTPGPHWVSVKSLELGEALPPQERQELKPGRCDGFHPEYTEAFDIAGLRGAVELAEALGSKEEVEQWSKLAGELFATYDEKFGDKLQHEYGSYSVLWPCHLYPTDHGKACDQFRNVGAQQPESWRYFPLATAHQGLLAGNREAGYRTLEIHLAHEQMRGWYAFDEGGGSGSGGWYRTRTTWPHNKEKPGQNESVAMPHGWAIAEFWLLMRDSIVFEDGQRLVLLGGVSPAWFRAPEGMRVNRLVTYFGSLDMAYHPAPDGAELMLSGSAAPPAGYLLRLPPALQATVWRGSERLEIRSNGDCPLAPGTTGVYIRFS
jgi:hypothetical protein